MQLSRLFELNCSLLFELSTNDVAQIRNDDLTLACGEVLKVGDAFTLIGSSGSAGNQPITLTSPWVQRYLGVIKAKPENFSNLYTPWHNQDFALFDAFNSETNEYGFVSPSRRAKWSGMKGVNDGFYIAYLKHYGNTLFHTRGGSASSICKCTSLTRWEHAS